MSTTRSNRVPFAGTLAAYRYERSRREIRYDKNGRCTTCGLQGSGFVSDGVCMCLDD